MGREPRSVRAIGSVNPTTPPSSVSYFKQMQTPLIPSDDYNLGPRVDIPAHQPPHYLNIHRAQQYSRNTALELS